MENLTIKIGGSQRWAREKFQCGEILDKCRLSFRGPTCRIEVCCLWEKKAWDREIRTLKQKLLKEVLQFYLALESWYFALIQWKETQEYWIQPASSDQQIKYTSVQLYNIKIIFVLEVIEHYVSFLPLDMRVQRMSLSFTKISLLILIVIESIPSWNNWMCTMFPAFFGDLAIL